MHKFNIEDAHYQNDYKILLAFDDGAEGVVDLKDFIFDKNCGVFKRLQNQEQFKNFALENHVGYCLDGSQCCRVNNGRGIRSWNSESFFIDD